MQAGQGWNPIGGFSFLLIDLTSLRAAENLTETILMGYTVGLMHLDPSWTLLFVSRVCRSQTIESLPLISSPFLYASWRIGLPLFATSLFAANFTSSASFLAFVYTLLPTRIPFICLVRPRSGKKSQVKPERGVGGGIRRGYWCSAPASTFSFSLAQVIERKGGEKREGRDGSQVERREAWVFGLIAAACWGRAVPMQWG